MSGFEATKQIHNRHSDIKVIGLSMHADNDVAQAMLVAGVCAYRTKNGNFEDLIASVWVSLRQGLRPVVQPQPPSSANKKIPPATQKEEEEEVGELPRVISRGRQKELKIW